MKSMKEMFEDILFDTENFVVEKTIYGKRGMISKLYKNDKLAAVKRLSNGKMTYKFYGI
ncbi:hypothetical protein HN028_14355 [Pantoea ananatis]|uniref:hypothetical protein n=1 Tax=Pantoea ananas TaxID=553 RepID=UPI003529E956